MGRVAVIGERALVQGYGLAGALVSIADDAEAVRAAWQALPAETALVILTPAAVAALDSRPGTDRHRLVVVLP